MLEQDISDTLDEFRCTCGKLLFKGSLVEGVVEAKCRACHSLVRWAVQAGIVRT